ncbi:MAG: hypothetical protein ACFCGT_23735 [Sandaracinaceae bacterium]
MHDPYDSGEIARDDALPVQLAIPAIEGFAASRLCPPGLRWHARSSLPLVPLFLSLGGHVSTRRIDWGALDPLELASTSMRQAGNDEELRFLSELLELTAGLYRWLGQAGELDEVTSRRLQTQLLQLSRSVLRPAGA